LCPSCGAKRYLNRTWSLSPALYRRITSVLALGVGVGHLEELMLGPLDEGLQGKERPGPAGGLLAVHLLQAKDVGTQPHQLGPQQRDPLLRDGKRPGLHLPPLPGAIPDSGPFSPDSRFESAEPPRW